MVIDLDNTYRMMIKMMIIMMMMVIMIIIIMMRMFMMKITKKNHNLSNFKAKSSRFCMWLYLDNTAR